jgi:predicted DNA-binding transcriptional regulator YafY
MRRADRLFQITQILRNRDVVTAKQLAERLQVSERTIYRDIQDLSLSGVPVEGEAGVGYMLRHCLDIPPIMFDPDELEALMLGAKMIKTWSSQQLAISANSALDKIEAVIPNELKTHLKNSRLFVPDFDITKQQKQHFEALRQAINNQLIVEIDYLALDEKQSSRRLSPLGLYYWGKVWTIVGWCHLRRSFRVFRVDRILQLITTTTHFDADQGQDLEDYIAIQKARYQDHTNNAMK